MGNLLWRRRQQPLRALGQDQMQENRSNFCFDVNQMIKVRNQHIGNEYVLIQPPVGKGAFGEVFKAYHINTQLIRSVKKVTSRNSTEHLEEYQVLRELDHPNLLKLYEVYVEGNICYLVTEYYDGGSLMRKITNSVSMNEALSARFLEQILMAIAYMNHKGYMHCDLKPDNILLEKSHKLIKIIDFGMSRKLNVNQCQLNSIGTQEYLAPEIHQGFIYPKSDVWACGVILLAMLTGKVPSSHKLYNGSFELDSDFATLLSPYVKDLLFRMISPVVSMRPTAQQALGHCWFRYHKQQRFVDVTEINHCLLNMKHYRKYNRLQCLFVSLICNYILSQEDILMSTEVFIECDKDSNGVISMRELKQVIEAVCPKSYEATSVDTLFTEMDKNNSLSIDLREFLSCSINPEKVLEKKHIHKVFMSIGSNSESQVTMSEFKSYVNSIVPDNGVREEMFQSIDLDKDGVITLEEFEWALRSNLKQ